MKIRPIALYTCVAACLLAAAWPTSAFADRVEELETRQRELSEEIENLKKALQDKSDSEVERRQGILTEEVRRLRESLVLPETTELKSAYGLGPAASRVYGVQRGLSIGGYGEFNFANEISDKSGSNDTFDILRFVLYTGYKYNDWIVLNSEIEFEHATSSSTVSSSDGSVSVEFLTLDFLLDERANLRGGLLLVPMGFVNEIHEPPFFHGNLRPQVEQRIIPSTWRAPGFGLFGELLPGLDYRTYLVTSMNAKGFSSSGVRGGRQKGNRNRADDWSWVGRVDYSLLEGATIGGGAFIGEQGQNQEFAGEKVDALMQMYEIHGETKWQGLELRALAAYIDLDDADKLSEDRGDTVAEEQFGWYAEVAYDILPLILPETTQYLAPWFRYSAIDTQDGVPDGYERNPARDREIIEVGLAYKPIPQIVVKLDYRNQDNKAGDEPDEIRIGAGFVF